MHLDKAHREGGVYRVGDRVVDAEGNDLGDEGVSIADQIDKKAVKEAKAAHEKAVEQQAQVASGGVLNGLTLLLGAASRQAAAGIGTTEPKAASQDADAVGSVGESAATLTGAAGPTPVGTRGVALNVPEATESVADKMRTAEEVLADNEAKAAKAAETAPARRKGGAKPVVIE